VEHQRTPEQLRHHYEIERELADRLRTAPTEDRTHLYSEVYDELFRSVPDHPQLVWKADPSIRSARVEKHLDTIGRFLPPGGTYLEVGAGDCALAFRVAEKASKVYAVEVSDEIVPDEGRPSNFELVMSDGKSIPVASGTVDVAFSDQLMEHLHPDDALDQLRGIHAALRPGGVYLCITPNRLSGPHDISKYFDDVATGFHLKEYTNRELARLVREVGFTSARSFLTLGGRTAVLPLALPLALEGTARSTGRLGRRVARSPLAAQALGNRLAAFK
jgi:SAM-dependent methyltransferase